MKVSLINSCYFNTSKLEPSAKMKVSIPIFKKSPELMSSAASSAIAASTLIKPLYSDLENKLINMGYEKDTNDGFIRHTFSEKEKEPYKQMFKDNTDIYLSNITHLSKDNIQQLKNFLNKDLKLGKEMYDNHFNSLMTVFCNLNFNNKINNLSDKNIYKMVTNLIINEIDEKGQKSVLEYKGKTYDGGIATQAQKYLRGINSEADIEVKDFIKNLSSYLNTQTVPENTKLYRGERLDVLKSVKTKEGTTVNFAQMLKDAAASKDYNKILEVKEFILNNNIIATQPAFMSTSTMEIGALERKGGILWEFETEPNTKGAYLEGINTSFYSFQDEVLIQKDSKIQIKSAEYDSYNDVWKIKASVSN